MIIAIFSAFEEQIEIHTVWYSIMQVQLCVVSVSYQTWWNNYDRTEKKTAWYDYLPVRFVVELEKEQKIPRMIWFF